MQAVSNKFAAAAAAKSLQLCPTLCDPIDSSPTSSTIPGILQARVLEWGPIAFSTNIFNKDLKEIKNKQKVMNNTISEIKNILDESIAE